MSVTRTPKEPIVVGSEVGCDCITQVQEQLKPEGLQLKRPMEFNLKAGIGRMGPPLLMVERTASSKSKKKIPMIPCAFCPFCGTKYPD